MILAGILWIISCAALGIFSHIITRGSPVGIVLAGALGFTFGPDILNFFIGVFQ